MRVLKRVWRVVRYPLLYMGVQTVVMAVYYLLSALFAFAGMGMGVFELSAQEMLELVMDSSDLQVPLVISIAITLALVLLINRKSFAETRFFGLNGSGRSLPFCALQGMFTAVLLGILIAVTNAVELFPDYERVSETISSGSFILKIVGIGLLGPLLEEIVFRGIVLRELAPRMKRPFAIVVSALVFGLIHMNPLQSIYTFILGLILAALYFRYDSIWPPVVFHAAFNLYPQIVSELGIGEDSDNAAVFGLVVILLIVAFVALAILERRRRKGREPE